MFTHCVSYTLKDAKVTRLDFLSFPASWVFKNVWLLIYIIPFHKHPLEKSGTLSLQSLPKMRQKQKCDVFSIEDHLHTEQSVCIIHKKCKFFSTFIFITTSTTTVIPRCHRVSRQSASCVMFLLHDPPSNHAYPLLTLSLLLL